LPSRLIIIQKTKTDYTADDKYKLEVFSNNTFKLGVTDALNELLNYREAVNDNFMKNYQLAQRIFYEKVRATGANVKSRYIDNISIVLSIAACLADAKCVLPYYAFEPAERKADDKKLCLQNLLFQNMEKQLKMTTGTDERHILWMLIKDLASSGDLKKGVHFELKQEKGTGAIQLAIRLSDIHSIINESIGRQRINMPNLLTVISYLKQCPAYLSNNTVTRFSNTPVAKGMKAWRFDMKKLTQKYGLEDYHFATDHTALTEEVTEESEKEPF